MKLKTVDNTNNIILKDYSEAECRRILEEKDAYVLKCIRSHGMDYGGSQCSEEQEETYIEIVPERVLVRGGHFCGVSMIGEYKCYNGGDTSTIREVCLFADESCAGSARDGFSFSNDDHDRWDYADYCLVRRPE